jgi:peptidoglycan/xylan/chitin deacetylase (PgdA/CDA1 family)
MFKSPFARVAGCSLSMLIAAFPVLADPPHARSQPTQYVLISFDSAHELSQWRRSRALARRTGAKFTYFLSCVFLLSPETRKTYRPPGMKPGSSNIGFAGSKEEVEQRLYQIRLAAHEGHEMGSHGCGHFDGKGWSQADWAAEFGQFKTILTGAYSINDLGPEPSDWRGIAESIHGFRAPYLSTSKAMFRALDAAGFAYDASGVSKGPARPDLTDKPARFALPQIPEDQTSAASSPWITICSCATPAVSSAPTRRACSRRVRSKRSVKPSRRNIRVIAPRFRSAFTFR